MVYVNIYGVYVLLCDSCMRYLFRFLSCMCASCLFCIVLTCFIVVCLFYLCFVFVAFFFFFFQAEDGIRDGRVTGVQTCALPIFTPLYLRGRPIDGGAVLAIFKIRLTSVSFRSLNTNRGAPRAYKRRARAGAIFSRSEERRVGKECRSRWSRWHEKEKNQRVDGQY